MDAGEANVQHALDVIHKYLQLSKDDPKDFERFDMYELKDAIYLIFGYSVIHFIKQDDRTISRTDLQTDLQFLVDKIKNIES